MINVLTEIEKNNWLIL